MANHFARTLRDYTPSNDFDTEAEPKSFYDYVKEITDRGYSVRLQTFVEGSSGVVHYVDAMCESPHEKIVILRTVSARNDKVGDSTDPYYNPITNNLIKVIAIAHDCLAKPCLVVDADLDNKTKEIAKSSKVLVLKE